MRKEFKKLYAMCPLKGFSSINIGSHMMQKECGRLIDKFDKKYGEGSYEELKSWSGWLGSYFSK